MSIFKDRDYSMISGYRNRAAAYAMELSTCENLLAMGYTVCSGVNIARRIDWLTKEIDRLIDLAKKTERTKEGVSWV